MLVNVVARKKSFSNQLYIDEMFQSMSTYRVTNTTAYSSTDFREMPAHDPVDSIFLSRSTLLAKCSKSPRNRKTVNPIVSSFKNNAKFESLDSMACSSRLE